MTVLFGIAERFPLGQVLITPGAMAALEAIHQTPYAFLSRHAQGDWGNLCDTDRQENARALQSGFRLFSSYALGDGQCLWIITEADRSVTTLLLPLEY